MRQGATTSGADVAEALEAASIVSDTQSVRSNKNRSRQKKAASLADGWDDAETYSGAVSASGWDGADEYGAMAVTSKTRQRDAVTSCKNAADSYAEAEEYSR